MKFLAKSFGTFSANSFARSSAKAPARHLARQGAAALIVIGFGLSLSGCATLSENQCRSADWESIGYQDGSRGYNAGRIADHGEACAEYGVSPDRQEYEAGRFRGLELFCTDRNGMQYGRQGSGYSGVCPADLEPQFLEGYELGRRMHDFDQHMSQLQNEIQQVQKELRQEEPPLKDTDRDRLLYRLRDLEREYGRSEADLHRLETRARNY